MKHKLKSEYKVKSIYQITNRIRSGDGRGMRVIIIIIGNIY